MTPDHQKLSTPWLLMLAVLVAAAGCGVTESLTSSGAPDWAAVERAIRREPIVRDVQYDPADGFVVVTVAEGTNVSTATRIGCEVVLPRITEAGSVALFAVYDESGKILSSWIGCE